MIPEIRKILYTTDLSPDSDLAFSFAVNLARQHKAKIIVLHVLEVISEMQTIMLSSDLVEAHRKKIFEEALDQIKDRIKLFFEKELKNDPDYTNRVASIEVLEGYPAEVILREADHLNCDMIVMGSHGKGTITQTFLGSVTKRVLRRTRKPVFIAPLTKGKTETTVHDI